MGRKITMSDSPSDASPAKVDNEDGLILTAIVNNDKHYLVELLAQGCSPMGDPSKPEASSPLDLAISLQNLDVVRILLRYGACMRSGSRAPNNPTAMHCAVLNRQKPMIRRLLEGKVDWTRSDGNGATVLHMAFELDETTVEDEEDDGMPKPAKVPRMDFSVEQEIIEILTIFLNLGANVNAETNVGETALFLALKRGMIEVAGFLIERGANVHVRDYMGNSLIHLLINDEADEPEFDEDDEEAEEEFAQKNNATFVNWLLGKGVSADCKNARGEVPAQLAIEYKLRDTLLVLLKHVNPRFVNDEAESWLHVFVKMYQSSERTEDFLTLEELHKVVRDLVARGVPVDGVDCYGQTLFHAAIRMRNPELLGQIAERFTNVLATNSEGEGVLHALVSRCIDDERAREQAYADVARVLCAKGASPNRKDKRGMSAVHLAAQYRYAKIVRVFAEAGADLGACTDEGDSLLHIVSAGSLSRPTDEADEAILELALDRGCEVDRAKPRGGWTALHLAASSGNSRLARRLLKRGARVDCRSDDGYTPLHLAARTCTQPDDPLIPLLLESGARTQAKNSAGLTPLHLAVMSNCGAALCQLLKFNVSLDDVPTNVRALAMASRDMCAHVVAHLSKLRAAGLPEAERLREAFASVSAEAAAALQSGRDNDAHKREVEAMKAHAIDEQVSLYQLLRMPRDSRFAFLKNRSLDLAQIDAKYPNYCGFVRTLYFEARERKSLVEAARAALKELSTIRLPDNCAECIFSFLNNECLKNMIDAAENS